ncbi:hypothetical protein [Pseudonocardia sp. MH-G8]|uniref:hypothetical protein n=1 Tax=Pseudonocardia sp. MH-G8 TaxID=1854588 RepID=UPI000BD103E5|nr:hypothetical protein [Pseudonocardia sp. MH-G8]OZM82874.1 hypothetical protein CFP66_09420 [Pseudonocardia sp. MH-G8]
MPKIHVTVWDGPEGADRAVFVHGSTTWGTSAFARQRPLTSEHRLELVDRRGYGRSPALEVLDGEGAHRDPQR